MADLSETISQHELVSKYVFDTSTLEYCHKESASKIIISAFGAGLYPIEVDGAGNCWWTRYNGLRIYVDWSSLALAPSLEGGFKTFAKYRLQKNSPLYLLSIVSVCRKISGALSSSDFSCCDISAIHRFWEELRFDRKEQGTFREAYRFLAARGLAGAKAEIAKALGDWKSVTKRRENADVLQWHPTRGSLTLEEWRVLVETVRSPLAAIPASERRPRDLVARMFMWLVSLTGKRPVQLAGMDADSVRQLDGEWVALMPPAKSQADRDLVLVTIHDPNFVELMSYLQSIPSIKEQQERTGKLFVTPRMVNQRMSSGRLCELWGQWWRSKKRLSPRAGVGDLHVTASRVRHTIGTQMAMNGVPRSVIASVLEHDSESSCQAYIDAVQTELCRQLNEVDSNMDGVFTKLNSAFFEGAVVADVPPEKAIHVPQGQKTPLLVGACGRDTALQGVCEKHPYISCYGGCRSFRPWRNGPHEQARVQIHHEIDRMKGAEVPVNFSARHLSTLLDASRGVDAVIEAVSRSVRDEGLTTS